MPLFRKIHIKNFHMYAVILLVFIFQYINSDYGNKVNDFPYLQNSTIETSDIGNAMSRNAVNGYDVRSENVSKWLMRFRLYSIEADEMLNIMALGRIKPSKLEFDPHYYAYGGAYLYPLGAWYAMLKKIGVIKVGDLKWMIDHSDEMENIYHYGRVFVLFSFVLSALLMFYTLKSFSSPKFSFLATTIYLIMPINIMFSIIMKPYVYSLLWVNLSLFILSIAWSKKKLTTGLSLAMGVSLGMAVGSVIINGLFAVIVWLIIVYFSIHSKINISKVFIIPIVAILVFFITNPYIFINYDAYVEELSRQSDWFFIGRQPKFVMDFVSNSVIPGFGIAFTALMLYALLSSIFTSSHVINKIVSYSIVAIIVFISLISASISEWHINARYVLYFIPIIFILFSFSLNRNKIRVLKVVLFVTLIQSAPLFIAYIDEDSYEHSTRIKSAEWINNQNMLVCSDGEIAPYDTPPFDFLSLFATKDKCQLVVKIDRQSNIAVDEKPGLRLVKRFEPRLNFSNIPVIYSHINPQISIFKKYEK